MSLEEMYSYRPKCQTVILSYDMKRLALSICFKWFTVSMGFVSIVGGTLGVRAVPVVGAELLSLCFLNFEIKLIMEVLAIDSIFAKVEVIFP